MSDSLINLIRQRTVLVAAGDAVGTGTMILPGQVLTCAHVVRNALKNEEIIEVLMPDPDLPGHYSWSEKAKNVVLSEPYKELRFASDDLSETLPEEVITEYPDVALITIEYSDHKLLRIPDFRDVPDDLRGGHFLAFGFQKRDRNLDRNIPQAVSLNYSGEQVDGEHRKYMFVNGLIRPGMSGAALIDRNKGQLIGIVHMTMNPNDDLGAYVIPVKNIWKVFKDWQNTGVNDVFSSLQSDIHRAAVSKQYSQEYPKFPILKKLGVKLFIILLLIFSMLWWLFYHIGAIQQSSLAAIIIVAVSILGTLLKDWLGSEINIETNELRSKLGRIIFSNTFLYFFLISNILLWSFTSSIWIYHNSSESDYLPPIICNKNRVRNFNPEGVARFLVLSTPFGKTIEIAPYGSEPKKINVQSFYKRKLIFPDSFSSEPIVVLRFDPQYIHLMQKYKVLIDVNKCNYEDDIDSSISRIDSTLSEIGSIIIGERDVKINSVKEAEWVQSFRNEDISLVFINQTISKWRNTESIDGINLNKGDSISVMVSKISDNSVYCEETFIIQDEDLDEIIKFKKRKKNEK